MLKKYTFFFIKKPVKILNNIYNNNFIFLIWALQSCCKVFADVKAIYFIALRWIMNVWSGFETLKTQLLGKHILIIFFLWKWIKFIFVLFVLTNCLKRCLELGVLLWNRLELLYSLRREIGAGPPGAPFGPLLWNFYSS